MMSADSKRNRMCYKSTNYDLLGYATMTHACYSISEDWGSSFLQNPENPGTDVSNYRVSHLGRQ
jgi:hypothetical protein